MFAVGRKLSQLKANENFLKHAEKRIRSWKSASPTAAQFFNDDVNTYNSHRPDSEVFVASYMNLKTRAMVQGFRRRPPSG